MLDGTAFGALIKRKRGEKGWSQQELASRIWADPGRKGDISRIENAKVKPQEKTIQELCQALDISEAELAPIRMARPSAKQLDQIPTLSRDELELLAARFELDRPFDRSDADLRQFLTLKAEEFRDLKAELEQVQRTYPRLDNEISEALRLLDEGQANTDEVRRIVHDARRMLLDGKLREPLEEYAKLAELEARALLLDGKVDEASKTLTEGADALAVIDPLAPARRKLVFEDILYQHGLRYGGRGLACSVAMVENALKTLTRESNPQAWAMAQDHLANALATLATRSDGELGTALLTRAIASYEGALTVRTRTEHPVHWASTQQNLANALSTLAERHDGEEATALLTRAIASYEATLTVFTRSDRPVQWATTLQNLAIALHTLASRSGGEEATALLIRAIKAYGDALTFTTRADHPVDWAQTQQNLAIAIVTLATRSDGEEATALLTSAIAAHEEALTVLTRADHPVHWATTQQNLALALETLANHSDVEEVAALLTRAIAAYEEALTVHTYNDHPAHWAFTQENLGILYSKWSLNPACTDPRAHMEQALTHVDAALTVYDPEHMPYYHAKATRLRDALLTILAAL